MAGSSVTFTYDETGPIKKIIADWVSDDAAGTASSTTKKIVGRLIKGVTDPGATAPSANYDITITDEEGVDVLAACIAAGRLDNRHTSTSEQVYFFVLNQDGTPLATSVHPVVCDKLTISIANAGNSKLGQLILYWE